jgi:hypothetical protein
MKKIVVLTALIVLIGIGVRWLMRPAAPVAPPPVAATNGVKAKAPAPPPVVTVAPVTPPPVAPTPIERQRAAADVEAFRLRSSAGPTVAELVLPGNRIFDANLGLMANYPKDWTVREVAMRWGANNGENTVFFGPPEGNQAQPSMYYRKYSDTAPFDMSNPEATLRDMARQKEVSRLTVSSDYKNDPDSFVFRTFDGKPSLSYFATYTNPTNGEMHAEYFMRVLGPTGYVMYFTRGPVKDVQALIPAVFEMGGTVKPP